ncbi:MAG TPA: hypothetical protein PKZ24_00120 [Nitrospirales bacterium]|nr:hypothetical protein [Nitrospira sp.]HQU27519.1 hypothetical protein [Nitrospirales bacterium]
MLYFRTKPDPVFLVLVEEALRWELAGFRRISAANDLESWFVEYPVLERVFTPYSAMVALEDLLRAHAQDTVYRPTDFHWLAIYECLKNYCLWHNDRLSDSKEPFLRLQAYRFGYLDFEAIVERYFWDEDFLILPQPDRDSQRCGCASTDPDWVEDLSMGLRPHPSCLRFSVVHEMAWHVPQPQECGQWRLP